MSGGAKQEITAPVPGSLTDVAKSLRELLGLVEDLRKGGSWVIDLYQGRKKKQAAQNLETLRFSKTGSKSHLERIIAGTYTPADIEAIGRQMAETANEVETSIVELNRFKGKIRETYGMAAAELLERLIYGPAGKRAIRYTLIDLVECGRRPDTKPKHIKSKAQQALRFIDQLNDDLRELHDLVLFGKK